MTERSSDRRTGWIPRPRPEWVRRINLEGLALDAHGVVPLDEESLLRTAMHNTDLSDFGDETWREPFRILLRSLEEEADLNLMGRLYTRSDLLIHLEGRLQIIDWYKKHPEVEDEQIESPVFVVGLPRSGTTIMQEILGADPGSRTVRLWEAKFPCPPPRPNDPTPDPRIARADAIATMQDRITPEWAGMHKVGGDLPVECIEFMYSSFLSDAFSASFQVPTYSNYVANSDASHAFAWHKRVLKLLQSTWRPKRWLLKGPTHIPHLPTLFATYPDAKIVLMLRDPLKALASVVDVCGTLFWMRSDDPFSGDSYGHFLSADPVVANLERMIGWMEDGVIPRERIQPVRYLDFFADPARELRNLYAKLELPLSKESERAMLDYIGNKPKGKFGEHEYETGEHSEIANDREKFRKFQEFFSIQDEC
ncbi:MAG: sulfotransferase [Myxococcota bacterium]